MKKAVSLYGIAGGILIAALRLVEYRFLVLQQSAEIYGGVIGTPIKRSSLARSAGL